MIQAPKQELDVTSTLEGREIGMTIDENSLQHIMAVLTDLYSDPLLACVREYSTNARDAHIAAGNDDEPIEVYTPTALSPSLRIIDHGVGMDEDDIENIYSKYGASTKNTSNEFNGVLGLGCKSALTYTSQFTVVGIKDGYRTIVSVSRDEEGVGSMTVLDSGATNAPNGVEIQIPIKSHDRDDVKEKAQEFFRYWDPGTVLLNSAEPERVTGMKIGDHIILEQVGYYYDVKHLLVMGGVAYPIENKDYDPARTFEVPDGYRVVAYVPNGSVHFTPSREALSYTNRTKDVIKQLVVTFKQDLEAAVTKEIEAQSAKHDAVQAAIRWLNVLPAALRQSKFMYRGIELPAQLKPDQGHTWLISEGKENRDWYGKRTNVGKSSHVATLAISQVPGCIFVTDFNRTFTPTVKHKLWEYCNQNKIDYPDHFVMASQGVSSPWIDPSQVISWPNDVEPIKLPRHQTYTRNGQKRLAGSYDVYEDSVNITREMAAQDIRDKIDDGKSVYYYVGSSSSAYAYAQVMHKLYDEFMIVVFGYNRKDKFKRLYPEAEPIETVVEDSCAWVASQFSAYELRVIAYHRGNPYKYNSLPSTIKDKEIRALLQLRDHDPKHRAWLVDTYGMVARYAPAGAGTPILPRLPDPLEKYPLVRHRYIPDKHSVEGKHMLLYINMIYEMEQSTNA